MLSGVYGLYVYIRRSPRAVFLWSLGLLDDVLLNYGHTSDADAFRYLFFVPPDLLSSSSPHRARPRLAPFSTQGMTTSAATRRWSLASMPSSESAVSTNTPFAPLPHGHINFLPCETGNRDHVPPAVAAPKYKINARLIVLAVVESGKRRPLSANARTWRDGSQIAHHECVLSLQGRTRRVLTGRKREAPSELVRDRGRGYDACEHGIGAAVGSARRTTHSTT